MTSILFRQISGGDRVPKFDGTVNRLFGEMITLLFIPLNLRDICKSIHPRAPINVDTEVTLGYDCLLLLFLQGDVGTHFTVALL